MKNLTFLFLLLCQIGFAQNDLIDQTIKKIDFKQDTIKSIYDWVTDNIRYDVKKLASINDGSIKNKRGEFNSAEEYDAYLLKKVLENKKGVCQDYSLLFDGLVKRLGYDSYVVEGITKNSKGKLNRRIGHTWNAVKVNGHWKLFDPTWGAGYVLDGKKFVKKYNDKWYDVSAEELITNHMPFDPIWQLSAKPIDYNSFTEEGKGKIIDKNFDFDSLISEYLSFGYTEKIQSRLSRSENMDASLRLIQNWKKHQKEEVNHIDLSANLGTLTSGNEYTQFAVDAFNDYIAAKNKRFKSKKHSLENAKSLLDISKDNGEKALAIYKGIDISDKKAQVVLNRNIRNIESLLRKVNIEYKFLKKLK